MVLPALPLIAAGLLGGAGGFGLSSLFKGTKKEEHVHTTSTYAPTIAPTTTHTEAWQYSPVQTYAPTYQYQIESPGAEMVSKKTITQESYPEQRLDPRVSPTVSPSITTEGGEGTDFTVLALIAAAAIIGYGLTTRGEKKK